MKKAFVLALFLVLALSIAIPSLAFAQDLLPAADMLAPVGMVAFGAFGLVGGSVGYFLRQRSSRGSEDSGIPEPDLEK